MPLMPPISPHCWLPPGGPYPFAPPPVCTPVQVFYLAYRHPGATP